MRKINFIFFVIAVFAALLILAGCGNPEPAASPSPAAGAAAAGAPGAPVGDKATTDNLRQMKKD